MSRKNKEAKWQLLSKSGIFPTNQDSVWQLHNNVDITTITSYNNVKKYVYLKDPLAYLCYDLFVSSHTDCMLPKKSTLIENKQEF
jgi:hypothetical protein